LAVFVIVDGVMIAPPGQR